MSFIAFLDWLFTINAVLYGYKPYSQVFFTATSYTQINSLLDNRHTLLQPVLEQNQAFNLPWSYRWKWWNLNVNRYMHQDFTELDSKPTNGNSPLLYKVPCSAVWYTWIEIAHWCSCQTIYRLNQYRFCSTEDTKQISAFLDLPIYRRVVCICSTITGVSTLLQLYTIFLLFFAL